VVDRRGLVQVAAGVSGAALCLIALALVLGGGGPVHVPGLPAAPGVVQWFLAFAPWLHLVLGTATLAAGLLAGGLITEPVGRARLLALAWAGTLLLTFVLIGVSQHALGVPVREFPASPEATGVFMALLAVGFTAYVARDVPRAVLPLSLLGLLPPLLTGHVRTAEIPWLTGLALCAHVTGAALWVGGLLAVGYLALRLPQRWSEALRRYSPIALVAAVVVAASGVVVAVSRVRSLGDLGDAYGVLVLAKVVALLALVGFGVLQRRRILAVGTAGRGAFVLLAGLELTLMALTFALAAALSQTPPP
jgi:putative copper resistance protein D